MATRLSDPRIQVEGADGRPLSGAKLYTYVTGTSTPKPTYSDAALTVLHTNPVEANAAGRFPAIFLTTGDYKTELRDANDVVIATDDPVEGATGSNAAPGAGLRNVLVNGDFAGSTFTIATATDGGDIANGWYALNQTAGTTAAAQTLQQDGIPNNIRLTQSNAGAQRHGAAQIVRSADTVRLRGSSITLSAKIRRSLSAPINYAVLSWAGTADAVTRDVVLDWTNGSYTPSNFFISTVAVVASGTITPTAGTWTSVSAITGAVSSAANNLVVFFWTSGTTVLNATLDVTQVQVEQGTSATSYEFLNRALAVLPSGFETISVTPVVGSPSEVNVALPAGYSEFRISIDQIRPSTGAAGNDLYLRVSNDGGATYYIGATEYVQQGIYIQAGVGTGVSSASSIVSLTFGGHSVPPDAVTGELQVFPGDGTDRGKINNQGTRWVNNAGSISVSFVGGFLITPATRWTNLKFGWNGGTTFANVGRIKVMGLRL